MKLVNKVNQLQDKPKSIQKILEFDGAKVLNLQLKKGESVPQHDAPENVLVIVQKGRLLFDVDGTKSELTVDNFIYMEPFEKHSFEALEDCDALVVKINAQN